MNKRYAYTTDGVRYASVVWCPARKVWFHVTARGSSSEPYDYVVTDEHGNDLCRFTWIHGGPNVEFWRFVDEGRAA